MVNNQGKGGQEVYFMYEKDVLAVYTNNVKKINKNYVILRNN